MKAPKAMQAIILHPDLSSFMSDKRLEVARGIAFGCVDTVKSLFRRHKMTTHGFVGTKVEDGNVHEFLEWCFDHTNTDEAYREGAEGPQRGLSVGDVVIVFDVGAYACMSSGWSLID